MSNSTEGHLEHQRKSWCGQNCRGMDFSGLNLCNVDFTDAILDGANFRGADLRGAIFRCSSLVGANLTNIRSGVSRNREIFIKVIFILLTILTGLSIGFVGDKIVFLLIDDSQSIVSYREIKFWLPLTTISGLIAICCMAIYSYTFLWKKPITAILSSILYFIIVQVTLPGIVSQACLSTQSCELKVEGMAVTTWGVIGNVYMEVESTAMILVMQFIAATIALAIFRGVLKSDMQMKIALSIGILLSLILLFTSNISLNIIPIPIALFISTAIIYLGWEIGTRTRLKHRDYRSLDKVITYISTYYGTCFDRANLTDASLEYADLMNANLRAANLTRTNFYGSKQIHTARVDRTILVEPLVYDLLVTHQEANRGYANLNLQGAYLVGADLQNADLSGANLNDSNLSNARLDHANLTRILALNTNLAEASLTGACIADWSIDRTTNLANIRCDYVYLKSPMEERTPASGSFTPGGFTRLFQEVWNTVDLIFDRGIDLTSFSRAWQQIQIENDGYLLEIKSIDRKGEGTIVIKVEVPRELDKANFHREFDRYYQLGLAAAADKYLAELDGKERELAIYREQQVNLQSLLQSLVKPATLTGTTEQVVFLKLSDRDLQDAIDVKVEIADRGMTARAATRGRLEHLNEIILAYTNWQTSYRLYIEGIDTRINLSQNQTTNLNDLRSIQDCQTVAETLKQKLNKWLDSSEFKPIKELMLKELHPSQSIQIIIQTDNSKIRQLPWQLWNFIESFRHAEITFASHIYQSVNRSQRHQQHLQVLAIMGNSEGLDLTVDRQLLTTLPHANVEFAIAPSRQELNDRLWEQAWDIIFFAGHSSSDRTLERGYIELNSTERVSITELKYAFQKSIERGLKLVILNSCDGLGIATELISIQLSNAIFMREPIPDVVAQQFLRHLLTALSNGLPLYIAVREAREKLQGLEDRYPCATWLPVICQNPSEIGG